MQDGVESLPWECQYCTTMFNPPDADRCRTCKLPCGNRKDWRVITHRFGFRNRRRRNYKCRIRR